MTMSLAVGSSTGRGAGSLFREVLAGIGDEWVLGVFEFEVLRAATVGGGMESVASCSTGIATSAPGPCDRPRPTLSTAYRVDNKFTKIRLT